MLRLKLLFYFCLCHVFVSASIRPKRQSAENELLVCPPSVGCIRGILLDGYQTGTFEGYMGIPYALPPLGILRFRRPIKMVKLPFEIDGTGAKADCIQKNHLLPNPVIQGQEDCLYLNVYRPVRRFERLPVMVYIHGGGFFSGSAGPAMTGPEYFMDTESVILVTVSYRLGALGFLSTGETDMPGNFGLKDQNLALQWVRDNIAYFEGDRNRVTLFGHGAGAVATHLHLLNPYSKNLFHRVITMSGTANVPFGITKNPLAQARKTAKLCGIQNAYSISVAELTEALREIDEITLINASDGLKEWDVYPLSNYRPVVEPPGILESMVSADPEILMREAIYEKRPWLLGTVPQEGAMRFVNLLSNTRLLSEFNERFHYLFEQMLEWPNRFTLSEKRDKTESVVVEYFKGIYFLNNRTKQGFMDSINDRSFKYPLYQTIKKYAGSKDSAGIRQYIYSFNYKGPKSYASIYTQANVTGKYGVVHSDDLLYLFRSPILFADFDKQSDETKVIESFVNLFVNFARFGYPHDFPKTNVCSLQVLDSRPSGICDYIEFMNSNSDADGFRVQVNSVYPTEKIKSWEEILEEVE